MCNGTAPETGMDATESTDVARVQECTRSPHKGFTRVLLVQELNAQFLYVRDALLRLSPHDVSIASHDPASTPVIPAGGIVVDGPGSGHGNGRSPEGATAGSSATSESSSKSTSVTTKAPNDTVSSTTTASPTSPMHATQEIVRKSDFVSLGRVDQLIVIDLSPVIQAQLPTQSPHVLQINSKNSVTIIQAVSQEQKELIRQLIAVHAANLQFPSIFPPPMRSINNNNNNNDTSTISSSVTSAVNATPVANTTSVTSPLSSVSSSTAHSPSNKQKGGVSQVSPNSKGSPNENGNPTTAEVAQFGTTPSVTVPEADQVPTLEMFKTIAQHYNEKLEKYAIYLRYLEDRVANRDAKIQQLAERYVQMEETNSILLDKLRDTVSSAERLSQRLNRISVNSEAAQSRVDELEQILDEKKIQLKKYTDMIPDLEKAVHIDRSLDSPKIIETRPSIAGSSRDRMQDSSVNSNNGPRAGSETRLNSRFGRQYNEAADSRDTRSAASAISSKDGYLDNENSSPNGSRESVHNRKKLGFAPRLSSTSGRASTGASPSDDYHENTVGSLQRYPSTNRRSVCIGEIEEDNKRDTEGALSRQNSGSKQHFMFSEISPHDSTLSFFKTQDSFFQSILSAANNALTESLGGVAEEENSGSTSGIAGATANQSSPPDPRGSTSSTSSKTSTFAKDKTIRELVEELIGEDLETFLSKILAMATSKAGIAVIVAIIAVIYIT